MGLRGFLVGKVEGLRIVFARELEHFLASDIVGPEIGFGADFQVFEILHGERVSGARGLARAFRLR